VNIIEARNLTKQYGDFIAVNDISFTVKKGEIFGFLGPNRAGKTTTINMLTGLARVTKGFIALAGIDCVKHMKKAQELMGIVPDESNLYPEMTGLENLCFCGALYGMDKANRAQRAWHLLELVGLKGAAHRRFGAYSRGMKRRLTIAAGIMHNPEVLFLDEPTTGIDVENARHIRKLLLDLNKNGTTIFLTTHYIEEAERLCHRIAFIVNGKIVKTDYTDELLKAAQEENTVQITAAEDISELPGLLRQVFPGYRFEIIDQRAIRIYSAEAIDLIPIIEVFKNNNLSVYEAKIVRPSLEDVFVKVTGIEAQEMKNEGGHK
jgi:ABC-2 type transport system ATP-binding protein